MEKERELVFKDDLGNEARGKYQLYGERGACIIEVQEPEQLKGEYTGYDYYEAFTNLRLKLENMNWAILCKGACRNVHQSAALCFAKSID